MKTNLWFSFLPLILLANIHGVFGQGTAFTYQGRLDDNASPANGLYDIRAGLFNTSIGGSVVAGPITNASVAVSNGQFTITLDYGSVFDGTPYWLELAVRSNNVGDFTILSPRRQLTPVPYAIFANTASNLSGILPATQISGTLPSAGISGTYANPVTFSNAGNSFSGSGAGLSGVNAASLGGLSVPNFWQTTGNAGVTAGTNFLGTTDNQPLDFRVNNDRALRLILRTDATGVYRNAPNVIGGSSVNLVSSGVVGGTVGGGGGRDTNAVFYPNEVNANFGTISGGYSNTITGSGVWAFIGGGQGNSVSQGFSTIGGGRQNTVNNAFATVGGGDQNIASGPEATVGGGFQNAAHGFGATVAGGGNNTASGDASTIGGGQGNMASGSYAMVGGGVSNVVTGTGSFIGGGGYEGLNYIGNAVQANAATIGGGLNNVIPSGGGQAFIGGGFGNYASGARAAVAGGDGNSASGAWAMIPGGSANSASGAFSFAAGYAATAAHDGSFVWADSSESNAGFSSTAANVFFARCTGGVKFVTAIDFFGDDAAGVKVAAGGTSWSAVCDRNAKKNFKPVDTVAVLNKLAAIPVEQWNYKWESDTNTPNIGPMAQDFKAAFFPGRDDKSISTLEFDGVELAAIQGLNEKLKAKDLEIQELKQKMAQFEELLHHLLTEQQGHR